MVRHRKPNRKARFEAALRLAEMTAEEWAKDKDLGGEVTRQHLYLVLKGERLSPRLTTAIDQFIAEMAPQMAA